MSVSLRVQVRCLLLKNMYSIAAADSSRRRRRTVYRNLPQEPCMAAALNLEQVSMARLGS